VCVCCVMLLFSRQKSAKEGCFVRVGRYVSILCICILLHELEGHVDFVWQRLFITCLTLTKWSLAHFAELRGLNLSSQNVY
jgi:hypothetical protein